MKIAVGISGGVDSATAAYLLKQAGNDVVGVIMKIYDGRPLPDTQGDACYGPHEQADISDAEKIADAIGIPLHVVDCSAQYNDIVLKYFDSEYQAGRTPNPC